MWRSTIHDPGYLPGVYGMVINSRDRTDLAGSIKGGSEIHELV